MAKRETKPERHTKEQFTGSRKYAAYRDALNALLDAGVTYTTEQVDKMLEAFLKKEAH